MYRFPVNKNSTFSPPLGCTPDSESDTDDSSYVRLRGVDAASSSISEAWRQAAPTCGATWEEEDDIPCALVDFVGQYEAGLDAEEEDEDAEDEDEEEPEA